MLNRQSNFCETLQHYRFATIACGIHVKYSVQPGFVKSVTHISNIFQNVITTFLFQGRCVFASGSPFDAVTVGGKTFYPGQGNNAYIFPAVGLATIACDIRNIPESLFLETAKVFSCFYHLSIETA